MSRKRAEKSVTSSPTADQPRTIVRVTCGWCMTKDHENCKRSLLWYDKNYVCACSCADEYYKSLT